MADPRKEIARALRADEWVQRHLGIVAHARDVADTAVAALEAAGFVLLPPGGEVSSQYGTRLSHPDRPDAQPVDDGPLGTLEDAKEYAREHVARGWVLDALLSREVRHWPGEAYYCGPWSPVVSDNSEVPND